MGHRMGRRSRITGTHRESPGITGTHRDSPVAVSPWAQRETGRAATEPRDGGAARRSLMAGHGSRGRALRNKRDWEVRGVHLRTKGGWRRSTGIRSPAVGSQIRNDRRLHGPSLKVASAALMPPVGNLSTGSALSAIPLRVKPSRFPSHPWGCPNRLVYALVSRVGPGVHSPVIPVSRCRAGPPAFSL